MVATTARVKLLPGQRSAPGVAVPVNYEWWCATAGMPASLHEWYRWIDAREAWATAHGVDEGPYALRRSDRGTLGPVYAVRAGWTAAWARPRSRTCRIDLTAGLQLHQPPQQMIELFDCRFRAPLRILLGERDEGGNEATVNQYAVRQFGQVVPNRPGPPVN